MLTNRDDAAEFMIHSHRLNLLQGNYAFFHVDFEFIKKWPLESWNVTREFLKRNILQGLISVSAGRPNNSDPIYNAFRADVKERLKRPPFNDSTNYTRTVSQTRYHIELFYAFYFPVITC